MKDECFTYRLYQTTLIVKELLQFEAKLLKKHFYLVFLRELLKRRYCTNKQMRFKGAKYTLEYILNPIFPQNIDSMVLTQSPPDLEESKSNWSSLGGYVWIYSADGVNWFKMA